MKYKIFDVFARNQFEGNPTTVVYYKEIFDKEKMQKIANELSLAHTIFISPKYDSKFLFDSLAFTPHQELKICSQGIIAAIFALLDDAPLHDDEYEVNTALGMKKVIIATPIEKLKFPEVYVSLGQALVKESKRKILHNALKTMQLSIDELKYDIIELGNKDRLVIQMNQKILEKISLDNIEVMKICDKLQLAGIIFFSFPQNKKNIRSRYFATSLQGKEDAVTGIASGSITAFCIHHKIIAEQEDIIVQQGGFDTREGIMYPKYRDKQIFVGGRAIKTAEGNLFL
ncbi:MAG: PhzF family phenazine biosynthesis protein [Candidatus Heimdallarchaeota archaeon]|nr:PhzF family phenazine biosynthesis protein [Candidatus Heimdallarchaeota archaeon]